MSRTLIFPSRYTHVVIEEEEYHPDADGNVEVTNSDHVPVLVRMGAVDISAARVEAPKAAPEPVEAIAVAPAPVEVTETPSETAENTLARPTQDATKKELIDWLHAHEIDASDNATKADLWVMVEEHLEVND
jgi:type IV secretory pathway VirJ component